MLEGGESQGTFPMGEKGDQVLIFHFVQTEQLKWCSSMKEKQASCRKANDKPMGMNSKP